MYLKECKKQAQGKQKNIKSIKIAKHKKISLLWEKRTDEDERCNTSREGGKGNAMYKIIQQSKQTDTKHGTSIKHNERMKKKSLSMSWRSKQHELIVHISHHSSPT